MPPGRGSYPTTPRPSTPQSAGPSAGETTPPTVAYTPDRKGIHPQTHLVKFKGVLQAYAYAGFKNSGGALVPEVVSISPIYFFRYIKFN